MTDTMQDGERDDLYEMFNDCVNLSPNDLEKHLATDESKAVGQKKDEGEESTGHESGRHILSILRKKKDELTDDDYAHMNRVVGFIKRHAAQRPKDPEPDSAWVLSLKNWGHDPLK